MYLRGALDSEGKSTLACHRPQPMWQTFANLVFEQNTLVKYTEVMAQTTFPFTTASALVSSYETYAVFCWSILKIPGLNTGMPLGMAMNFKSLLNNMSNHNASFCQIVTNCHEIENERKVEEK